MFKNDKYVSGDENVQIPAHVNFGKFMLSKLLLFSEVDHIALMNGETEDEKLTYKELTQYAVDLSVALNKSGIRKGDVVAFGSERSVKFIPITLAIIFTGATCTPFDAFCGKAILKHQLRIAMPKYFICTQLFWDTNCEVLERFDGIKSFLTLDETPSFAISIKSLMDQHNEISRFEPAEVKGQSDVALILYSSGTTGMPKGVELTHLNCILHTMPSTYFQGDFIEKVFLFGEWSHNYHSFMTYKFLTIGRQIFYVSHVTPESMLQCFEKHQIDTIISYPSEIDKLMKADIKDYRLSSTKFVYSRSSPLHAKAIEAIKQIFPADITVFQGYGMTEAGEPTSECWGTKGPKPGSVGQASPGVTLKVVDPINRQVLGPKERGEICVKGPILMKGYIGINPSTYLDDEGFFKTGDLGYYDEDKYFFIVDRLKEVICCKGAKIAPLELETILLLHPAVKDAGVVGKPDPIYIEMPTAFVVKQTGVEVTEQELIEYVSSQVPEYMQLKGGVKFITVMPRNRSRKILRRQLREMLNEMQ